ILPREQERKGDPLVDQPSNDAFRSVSLLAEHRGELAIFAPRLDRIAELIDTVVVAGAVVQVRRQWDTETGKVDGADRPITVALRPQGPGAIVKVGRRARRHDFPHPPIHEIIVVRSNQLAIARNANKLVVTIVFEFPPLKAPSSPPQPAGIVVFE